MPIDGDANDPDGSRTRVTAVKGRCPRPLDDGAGHSICRTRQCTGRRRCVKPANGSPAIPRKRRALKSPLHLENYVVSSLVACGSLPSALRWIAS